MTEHLLVISLTIIEEKEKDEYDKHGSWETAELDRDGW